jgi:phage terminase large subunit GpA-like protein
MDAISDPYVERVVVMSSARSGKTSACVLNPIGYYMQYDPSPIMVVMPTVELGEMFSKEQLEPMIADTPTIRNMLVKRNIRDNAQSCNLKNFRTTMSNTLCTKTFPGGFLQISGSNSPNTFRFHTIKILMFDEVDGAPESAGDEGDPVKLAETRTITYEGRGRKIILTSTPTNRGASRIERAYNESDMAQWCLPCPSCGALQPLEWDRLDYESLLLACRDCGCMHSKDEWLAGEGKWIQRKPEAKIRGFHLNALVSPFVRWETLVEEYDEAVRLSNQGNYQQLKVFVNTVLGEAWEERGDRVDETGLMARREEYFAEIPDGVCALTIGVDTQDNRLCYSVVGWGAGKESWAIEYGELWGDPRLNSSPVWGLLDNLITKKRCYANGVAVPVICTMIDSGGHATTQVAAYARSHQLWNVWAIRGEGGQGKPLIKSKSKNKNTGAIIHTLGVDTGKDDVVARLAVKEAGAGFVHFPRGTAYDAMNSYECVRGFDERFFAGLTAEKKIRTKDAKGFYKFNWVKVSNTPNEPFDTFVYATAALEFTKLNLDKIAERKAWADAAVAKNSTSIKAKAVKSKPKLKPLNGGGNSNYCLV